MVTLTDILTQSLIIGTILFAGWVVLVIGFEVSRCWRRFETRFVDDVPLSDKIKLTPLYVWRKVKTYDWAEVVKIGGGVFLFGVVVSFIIRVFLVGLLVLI